MGVLIVSLESHYSDLMAKTIRDLQVFSEVISYDSSHLEEKIEKYKAIIILGEQHNCPVNIDHERVVKKLLRIKKPILGIGSGMEIIHKILGGSIDYGGHPELGNIEVKNISDHLIIDGIPHTFNTWISHNNTILEIPPGFLSVSKTDKSHVIAINDQEKIYTVLFHPELERCSCGNRIISNFLFLICKIQKEWAIEDIANLKIERLRNQIENQHVLVAVSGGVNSYIVAKMIQKSCRNISLLFVKTGLLRKGKNKLVIEYFEDEFKNNFYVIDAETRFLKALKGIGDPEDKRRKIRNLFTEIFWEFLKEHEDIKYLALGTIKTDSIEFGEYQNHETLKTHHTPENKDQFQIIEPISDLFKSETKVLAYSLNLPDFIVHEQPCPEAGYATRIIGEITDKKLDVLKRADEIFTKKLKEKGIYSKLSQTFAILLDSKSIGILSGKRQYGHVIALRSVNTEDFIDAKVSEIPIEILIEIGNEITSSIPEVSRVVYDLTTKPPSIIEWE